MIVSCAYDIILINKYVCMDLCIGGTRHNTSSKLINYRWSVTRLIQLGQVSMAAATPAAVGDATLQKKKKSIFGTLFHRKKSNKKKDKKVSKTK